MGPIWCKEDTRWCPSHALHMRRCGATCKFPQCPEVALCDNERKRCQDGSWVTRNPRQNCIFDACPVEPTPTCDPRLSKLCPDGHTRVGRDPQNLCITWLPCPGAPANPTFLCANGWQRIPLDQVCNGVRRCNDGSDESPDWGCSIGPGRRLEDEPELVRVPVYRGVESESLATEDVESESLATEGMEVPGELEAPGDRLQRRLSFPTNVETGRACCYGLIASCLACREGVPVRRFCLREENRDVVDCERFWKPCCRAYNAECMSCAAGLSEREYCRRPQNAHVPGCEDRPSERCCRGYKAKCMSCTAGLSEREYCATQHTFVPGCEKFGY